MAVVCVLALGVTANAQAILHDGYLESQVNGGTLMRASSLNATTGRTIDSTAWILTDGWQRASLQHSFADSAAGDSTKYTIFARWSNDRTTPFLSDSLPPETVEGAANLDTLIIRPAKYVMLLVRANPGNESGAGATTYSFGRLFLLARGVRR